MLSKDELFNHHWPTTAPIPDDAPTVLFALGLGDKYEHVDFDYDAYRRAAKAVGMPPALSNDISIHIEDKNRLFLGGGYLPSEKKITVRPAKNGQATNADLVHEMKHAADDARNLLTSDLRYAVGRLGILAASIFPIPGAVVSWASSAIGDSRYSVAALVFVLTANAAGQYGYHNHPLEKRARDAAKTVHEQILTLEKK